MVDNQDPILAFAELQLSDRLVATKQMLSCISAIA